MIVLVISTPISISCETPQYMLCIWYLVIFQESQQIIALIDSNSKINAMIPAFAAKLGLTIQKPNIGAQKINGLSQKTHGIISAMFSLYNSLGKIWFFKQTFLQANSSLEMVLEMPFLSLSNTNIKFAEPRKVTQRLYDTVEALFTTSRIKLTNKKEFTKAALDENSKIFLVYVITLEVLTTMSIHFSKALHLKI